MKRHFVNLAALLLGLVLGGVATYASAEAGWNMEGPNPIQCQSSKTAACNAKCAAAGQGGIYGNPSYNAETNPTCYCVIGGAWNFGYVSCEMPNPCQAGGSSSASRYVGTFATGSGQSVYGVATATPSTLCDGTCTGTVNAVTSCDAGTATQGTPVQCSYSITLTGAQCSGSNGTAPVDPTIAAPNPPCSSGQGVISNAAGKVVCVNQGADFQGATYPPKENKTTSTTTNPDGSTKTVTNIQTCTGEGACSTSTTTTIGAATGGGAGTAGTPGTTTTSTDKPKSETSDFCAQFPNLQICKGDMNKESTQVQVRDELKKLTTPTVTDDSAITSATHSKQSDDDMKEEVKKLENVFKGETDPTSNSKSSWESAMSSGWWTPIPASTCSPLSGVVGGRTLTIDYCPTAAMISSWGGYALWFLTAIGLFMMLTGGKKEE